MTIRSRRAHSAGEGIFALLLSLAVLALGAAVSATPMTASAISSSLPYSADSYFKSSVLNAQVDQALTLSFRNFMSTHPDQKDIPYPKVNMNANWAMSYDISDDSDPVWHLKGGNTGSVPQLKVLTVGNQGFHMDDSVADTFPTGTQDRPGVIIDNAFGYTVQFADAVPDRATRTISVSNAGIMWHNSTGIDRRSVWATPSDDKNLMSRGRIPDAMVITREAIDRAVENDTDLGHVLHIFFVETDSSAGFLPPMTGAEKRKSGWGAEGQRIRLDPTIDLKAAGLTGACLAVGRTLQIRGGYLGDNSGSSTQLKASQAFHYEGTNLETNCFANTPVKWSNFEVLFTGNSIEAFQANTDASTSNILNSMNYTRQP